MHHLLPLLGVLPLSLAQLTVLTLLQPSPTPTQGNPLRPVIFSAPSPSNNDSDSNNNNNNPPSTTATLPNALPMTASTSIPPTPPISTSIPATSTSPSSLPSLLSLLPTCALPCFAQAARTINCSPSDLTCLCRANTNNAAALRLNVGTCLGGTSVFTGGDNPPPTTNDEGDGNEEQREEGCELDQLEELGDLAGRICDVVGDSRTTVGELEEGMGVIEEALARTSVTATGTGMGTENRGVKKEVSRAVGGLFGVAIFAFVVL